MKAKMSLGIKQLTQDHGQTLQLNTLLGLNTRELFATLLTSVCLSN